MGVGDCAFIEHMPVSPMTQNVRSFEGARRFLRSRIDSGKYAAGHTWVCEVIMMKTYLPFVAALAIGALFLTSCATEPTATTTTTQHTESTSVH